MMNPMNSNGYGEVSQKWMVDGGWWMVDGGWWLVNGCLCMAVYAGLFM